MVLTREQQQEQADAARHDMNTIAELSSLWVSLDEAHGCAVALAWTLETQNATDYAETLTKVAVAIHQQRCTVGDLKTLAKAAVK